MDRLPSQSSGYLTFPRSVSYVFARRGQFYYSRAHPAGPGGGRERAGDGRIQQPLFIGCQASGTDGKLIVISTADGNTFGTEFTPVVMGSSPAMTVFKNRLFLAFQANDPSHSLFVTSAADRVKFTNPPQSFPGTQLGSAPAMTALGGRLYIPFQAADDSADALSVTSSTDGVNFTTPTANPGILLGGAPGSGESDQRLFVASKLTTQRYLVSRLFFSGLERT
jgi:hypothetical protein